MPRLRHLMPTLNFFSDIYEQNSQPTDKYYDICQRYARLSRMCVQIGHIVFVGSVVLIILAGGIEQWRSHGKTQIIFVYIPGIYADSTHMLIILTLINLVMIIHAIPSMQPTDLLFFFTFSNVPMVPVIIHQLMAESNALLNVRSPNRAKNVAIVKDRCLQFVRIHQQYNE